MITLTREDLKNSKNIYIKNMFSNEASNGFIQNINIDNLLINEKEIKTKEDEIKLLKQINSQLGISNAEEITKTCRIKTSTFIKAIKNALITNKKLDEKFNVLIKIYKDQNQIYCNIELENLKLRDGTELGNISSVFIYDEKQKKNILKEINIDNSILHDILIKNKLQLDENNKVQSTTKEKSNLENCNFFKSLQKSTNSIQISEPIDLTKVAEQWCKDNTNNKIQYQYDTKTNRISYADEKQNSSELISVSKNKITLPNATKNHFLLALKASLEIIEIAKINNIVITGENKKEIDAILDYFLTNSDNNFTIKIAETNQTFKNKEDIKSYQKLFK
ncbi:MAG: hypothetical protein LEGION0398_MBIBDBAK_00113 [Legionellaceae bacterium]